MKKRFRGMAGLLFMPLLLTGCGRIGEKTAQLSAIYGVMMAFSLLLLIGYCAVVRKHNRWTLLLFCAVLVVNCGYFWLSLVSALEWALWANRVAYLGSVLLPLSMLMIAMDSCGIKKKKWLPALLLIVSLFVFLVAASPGILDIYYKEVSLVQNNGVTVLHKVYGPWHSLYLYYLLAYLAAMIVLIIHAIVRRKVESRLHVIFLAAIVCINIGVWLLGQLVQIDFETLSVSYIISEIFLLCLYLLGEENAKRTPPPAEEYPEADKDLSAQSAGSVSELTKQCEYFFENLSGLTRTERMVYDLYLAGNSSREIMEMLNIKENTLKYHNRNIYSKLGISSRKELLEIGKLLESEE